MRKLNVVFVASEMAPYAKTGGLADVVGSLPMVLRRLGHDVRIILPFYRSAKQANPETRVTVSELPVPIGTRWLTGSVLEATKEGVPIYFLQQDDLYDRPQLYGDADGDFRDNAFRFIFFSRAVAEILRAVQFRPDILHAHDWQAGFVPVFLATHLAGDSFFSNAASVFTIHNLAYQGLFNRDELWLTGLSSDLYHPGALEYFGKLNFMKAGIVFGNVVNTVSQKYSLEIQTPEYGVGLDGVLRSRSKDLYGILNGADYGDWSPEADRYIAAKYSADDLSGKKACRQDLLETFEMNLPEHAPLIGIVSRLADQKGFNLLAEVIEPLMRLDIGMVVLGTGDEKYHRLFRAMRDAFPEKIGVRLEFNNALAHKIEAGSDMFLMPSAYEPGGLNQIYSLKYGTIPVVRATGGLDDTIQSFDLLSGEGNGFKFNDYSGPALLGKLFEAITIFHSKPVWRPLMNSAMSADYSWEKSAHQYGVLYEKALAKKK